MHPIKLMATVMLFFAMAATPYVAISYLTTGGLQAILYALWTFMLFAVLTHPVRGIT